MTDHFGYWVAYTAAGVAVLVITQRMGHGAQRMPSPGDWFTDMAGSIIIVLAWPLIALLLLWVSFQQWRRYRPSRPRRNSN